MPSLQQPQAVLVALLSVLIPLSIFVGRRNVRIRRLRMLENLRLVLPRAGEWEVLQPSFDMVAARYCDEVQGSRPVARVLAWLKETGTYALPTLVFVLVSGCGFALLFELGGNWRQTTQTLLYGLRAPGGDPGDFASATGLVMAAGFVGAYIWSVDYLILRIANFDLSPLSFLSTSAHILLTVFVAWVLRHVVAAPAPAQALTVAVLLGVAFLCGLYPSLGVNVLIDRLPRWLRLKRDVPQASEIERSFPLDLIDGIDTAVKFRLNGLGVTDVQNLATANPVELFVETPYGFGQILDWMSQAQLLVELGPDRFIAARRSGVRDMATLLGLGRSGAGDGVVAPLLGTAGEPEAVLRARIGCIEGKLHVGQLAHWLSLFSRADGGPSARGAAGGTVVALKPTG